MLTLNQKFDYFLKSAVRYFEPVICPYCKSSESTLLDRKYLVTRLFECSNCSLCFRHPYEKIEMNSRFYQQEYVEKDLITTILPAEDELEKLKVQGFVHGNKNADRYIQIFRKLLPGIEGGRIVDYGASWGYLSWQFKQSGFDVNSYEISRFRAEYGNQYLQLDIKTNEADLRKDNHIFFSAHVIEHHPDIRSMIALAKTLLVKGGYFIAVSPNGSLQFRKKDPVAFHRGWGKVHPNYLSVDFYKYIFSEYAYYIGSSPFQYDQIHPLLDKEQIIDDLSSEELIVIVKF